MCFLKCKYCHRVDEIHRVMEGSITAHRRKKHPNAIMEAHGGYNTWTRLFNENMGNVQEEQRNTRNL